MIIKNNKPILIIGFEESSITHEAIYFLEEEGSVADKIISPKEFFDLKNKEDYQYHIGMGAFTGNLEERGKVCNILYDFDCVSIIHSTSFVARDFKIEKGLFVAPFVTILQRTKIDKFCWIESYSLVAHYCNIGKNCIINPGTLIGGKSVIGNNCILKMKSSVSNKIKICDNVIVGGFSSVTKDIIEPGIYVGTPARKIKSF
jgi:acetyltransferase-like isoleucine patch superfamily enzyme